MPFGDNVDVPYRLSMGYPVSEHDLEVARGEGWGGKLDTRLYQDIEGDDLAVYVEAPTLEEIQTLIEQAEKYLEQQTLSRERVDMMLDDAEVTHRVLERRLDEMSETDKLYAEALQDWVLEDLRRKESERGEVYEQGSEESHRATVNTLEKLLMQLEDEKEDPRLIELAQVWRKETLAELSIARLRELYRLAA